MNYVLCNFSAMRAKYCAPAKVSAELSTFCFPLLYSFFFGL